MSNLSPKSVYAKSISRYIILAIVFIACAFVMDKLSAIFPYEEHVLTSKYALCVDNKQFVINDGKVMKLKHLDDMQAKCPGGSLRTVYLISFDENQFKLEE